MNASILFVPVSHEVGAGEYYRCLNIALALHQRQPELAIHLCVNRAANVDRPDALTFHLFDQSPTSSHEQVIGLLEQLRPTVVVMDCNARQKQLEACRRVGAQVVFINDRPKKRLRGFQPGKMGLLREHWIQGARSDHRLKWYERLLLWFKGGVPKVRFFFTFQQPSDSQRRQAFLREQDFTHEQYALFAPGGGGGQMGGQPTAAVFQQAARQFQQETGTPVIFVAGPLSRETLASTPDRLELQAVAPHTFVDLIDGAELFITGAGSQMWQGLALQKPSVAVPTTGHEQAKRLQGMTGEGVILDAAPEPNALAEQAIRLWRSPDLQAQLLRRIEAGGYEDGTERACEYLLALCRAPAQTSA